MLLKHKLMPLLQQMILAHDMDKLLEIQSPVGQVMRVFPSLLDSLLQVELGMSIS